jgi:hypothetical protein
MRKVGQINKNTTKPLTIPIRRSDHIGYVTEELIIINEFIAASR